MRVNVAIGMLGILVGLAIAFMSGAGQQPVFAQSGNAGSSLAVAANYNNGEQDLVWLFDTKSKVLAVYKYQSNTIELIGARNAKNDMLIPSPGELRYKGQHLSPKKVEQAIEEIEKQNKSKENK